LGYLDIAEWRSLQRTRARAGQIPIVGSLSGMDANGARWEFAPQGSGYLLVFALRADRIASDIQFWNDVIRHVGSTRVPVTCVGVCDAGLACNDRRGHAGFTILSHMDPYQMRVVSETHAEGDSLLYSPTKTLEARLARTANPAAFAALLRRRTE